VSPSKNYSSNIAQIRAINIHKASQKKMITLTSYKKDFESKLDESRVINDITSKDIKDKAKAKEYEYPPLPTLVNAKNTYFSNRQN
jgi:hypothetical protein